MPGTPGPAMRAALAGLLAMATAMGIGRFVYTPILPLMIGEGALNASQAGLVAGFNYFGYLLGALVAALGFFAPRRRAWFLAALAASAATTLAMAWSGTLAAMIVVRFLSGIASAFSMIFVTAIVLARLGEEGRPGLIALHFGGVGFGIAGSAMLVSALAAAGVDWPEAWLASGVAASLAFVLVYLLLPPTESEARPPRRRARNGGASALPLALFVVGYGFFGFGYVVTATFINAMAKAEPALAAIEPFVWIIVGLSVLPSVWLWNRAAGRFGFAGAYSVACLAEAAGVGLSVTVVSPVALVVSAVLLGGTFVAVTALGLARARDMAPAHAAGVIALMTASFGLGQMTGPVVAGWLFERMGDLVLASWLAAAALVVAAVLAPLAIALSGRQSQAAAMVAGTGDKGAGNFV